MLIQGSLVCAQPVSLWAPVQLKARPSASSYWHPCTLINYRLRPPTDYMRFSGQKGYREQVTLTLIISYPFIRGVLHSQIGCTDFKSSKKSLDLLDFFSFSDLFGFYLILLEFIDFAGYFGFLNFFRIFRIFKFFPDISDFLDFFRIFRIF